MAKETCRKTGICIFQIQAERSNLLHRFIEEHHFFFCMWKPIFNSLETMLKAYHVSYESPFLIKHLHIGYVLDDEILWQILFAIEDSCLICFDFRDKHFIEILPVKISAYEEYGRRYVFAINLYENLCLPCLFRLDEINGLEIGEVVCQQGQLR